MDSFVVGKMEKKSDMFWGRERLGDQFLGI